MLARVRRRVWAPFYRLTENVVASAIKQPIVSFTFDDFPSSAASNGAQLLDAHDARGTFYVAGSLVGTTSDIYGAYCTRDDLTALHSRGHEIGCHTYGHTHVSTLSARGLIAELDRNVACIEPALGGQAMRSFAYPFGDMSPLRKLQAQTRFATCRGNVAGINAGKIDLGDLRAERIYEQTIDHDRVAALLKSITASPAWLVFYTHDVAERPSPYGCTPVTFERVVKQVKAAGATVLTVRDAAALASGH
jgi:peptidoglycan/xylan/chitin deacetylase (PgdA/CDA1 family)